MGYKVPIFHTPEGCLFRFQGLELKGEKGGVKGIINVREGPIGLVDSGVSGDYHKGDKGEKGGYRSVRGQFFISPKGVFVVFWGEGGKGSLLLNKWGGVGETRKIIGGGAGKKRGGEGEGHTERGGAKEEKGVKSSKWKRESV